LRAFADAFNPPLLNYAQLCFACSEPLSLASDARDVDHETNQRIIREHFIHDVGEISDDLGVIESESVLSTL
jgi:hypothetical protein